MAITINFDKAKAERLIECLEQGQPLAPARTVDDILALAGACFFVAMGKGSELYQAVDWSRIGRRQEDETEDTFFADLHAAIEYYGQLTMLVAAGEYDQTFEPRHQAIVMMEEGEKTVIPMEGMKEEGSETNAD